VDFPGKKWQKKLYKFMKVALVYDRINKWGGAERVLLALHKIFPDAPIFTSLYDKKKAKWAEAFEVKTSFLDRSDLLRERNDLLACFMPIAFESFSFDEYDIVISVSSEAAKGVITKPKTLHICYCLTPTRYLWSGYDEYFKSPMLRILSKPAVSYLRKWDEVASNRPDYYIAISTEVKNRIKKYYEKESEIIFPPVMLSAEAIKARKEYFLLVSRLSRHTSYKKVDLAIDAFNKKGDRLIVVGEGPMKKSLRQKSGNNIEFVGEVSDEELSRFYSGAKALIFPGLEDFGLVMAEAQSYGVPVIAYRGGGAMDIVEDGKTGLFFDDSLISSLEKFDERIYNDSRIKEASKRFSFDVFRENFERFLVEKQKEYFKS
jgi:glycosyltransferase involved in cell wall biosynthesis